MKNYCSWCGEGKPTMSNLDAADVKHYWHKRCWHAQLAWLRGHNPPTENLGKGWDDIRGPVKYRGIKSLEAAK